ncbi:MAG TPA: radical SAM family heme chaperone HemW [Bacilli bacterium]|nr:radical SAM family heme chaperone HemW [Bacilli bacterium]
MNAVYVHIPFCKHICSYCDFPKVLHINSFVDEYLDALQNEILNTYDGEIIKTLYVGGGTPSCLTKKERVKLFRILENFNKSPDCEYTFECNPGDIDDSFLDDIVDGGVNRLSIGVQSFDKDNLKFLDREIEYDDLENKLTLIRNRGIDNINLDLMYALPNEKLNTLKKDVSLLLKLKPAHISTYSLIIEKHTKVNNDKTEYIDEDLDRKMYDYICNKLAKSGYVHYEVSNFALPGCESKHNLNYWNNDEYYGFGLGAAGFKAGVRYSNTKNIDEYIKCNYRSEELLLSLKDQTDNELMLGLRKLAGVDVNVYYDKYGTNIQDDYPIKQMMEEGYLIYKSGYVFINPKYIYTMNEILIHLI